MTTERGPYCIVRDDDAHSYVIPVARERDWEKFLTSDDALDGVTPVWAESIGGSPSLVRFDRYTIT